jgi:thiol-disulfide isomerase/thioredoxin
MILRRIYLPTLLLAASVFFARPFFAQQPVAGSNAQKIMGQAETTAKSGDKRILLDFGASWCGNCHLFEKFVADPKIHPILEKYFVMVTLITGEHAADTKHFNTPGGPEFEDSIGGKGIGWPYIVILDASGKPIADSLRPVSKGGKENIGYPYARVEVDWFMQMLQKSVPALSEVDAATIHAWLTDHGEKN